MEQGAALNSGYMLAIDGDRRMMYEMIRLGVWYSLYSFRDVQGLSVAPVKNTGYNPPTFYVPWARTMVLLTVSSSVVPC